MNYYVSEATIMQILSSGGYIEKVLGFSPGIFLHNKDGEHVGYVRRDTLKKMRDAEIISFAMDDKRGVYVYELLKGEAQ